MQNANKQLARLVGCDVFIADGEPFTWADVVLAEIADGVWAELEGRVRQGLAAERLVPTAEESVLAGEVVEAARRFRYGRGLLAADQLQAWLDRWAITDGQWRDFLRRDALRRRSTGELPTAGVPDDEVRAAIGVDAICSGVLEQGAERLAVQVALSQAEQPASAGPPPDEARTQLRRDRIETASQLLGMAPAEVAGRIDRLAQLNADAAHARTELTSEHAVEEELGEHRLDWLSIEVEVLELTDADSAREAALLARSQRLPLAEVASRAGHVMDRLTVLLADAPEWLSPHLLTGEGTLRGPIPHDGVFAVVAVVSRRDPTSRDPDTRRRAETAIVERAVRRVAAERIEWRELP